MKKIYFLLSILAFIATTSCDDKSTDGCVQVKIVTEICGNAILQVVGGDVPDGIANSWTDNEGNTYENVFSTFLNPCSSYAPNGDTFYVKILDERNNSNCAVCLAIPADMPEEFLHTVISNECGVNESDL